MVRRLSHSPRPSNWQARLRSVNEYLGSYVSLALLVLVGVLIIGGAFTANRMLRPSRPIPGPGKFDTYECGLDPVQGGWAQVHIRYYVYAYL